MAVSAPTPLHPLLPQLEDAANDDEQLALVPHSDPEFDCLVNQMKAIFESTKARCILILCRVLVVIYRSIVLVVSHPRIT